MKHYDQITGRGLNIFALSAEAPAESHIMPAQHQAPFLFIADSNLAIIDHYDLRTTTFSYKLREFKTVARPGFILLHHGREVWRDIQHQYMRTPFTKTLEQIEQAMAEQDSAPPKEHETVKDLNDQNNR